MAQLLSPEVLIDLLDDGWPQSIVAESPPEAGRPSAKEARIGLGSPRMTWRDLFTLVETRGFHKFYLTLPGALGPESRVRLYFRFGPWFWRLYGVELPDVLARRLADELRKRIGRRP